jgi:hypothetical protein
MKLLRLVPIIALGLLGLSAPAAASVGSHFHHHPSPNVYTCTGGNVPSGTYGTLIIAGVCTATTGTVNVHRDLVVQPGALFDDLTAGDGPANSLPSTLATYTGFAPAGTPLISATVNVGGNIWVESGAVLLLGCSPNVTCPEGVTYGRVAGSITAIDSLGVVVHSTNVGGSISILGGGDGLTGSAACTADPAPWSEDATLAAAFLPPYTDVEDNVVGGNVTIAGQESCWFGALRNLVGGNMRLFNNVMGDPDSNEVGNNLVRGDMACAGNVPGTPPSPTPISTGIQFGDGGAGPSIVGGRAFGQCSFSATTLNPAPEAGEGTGITEHLTVSAWHLHRYGGRHIEVSNFAEAEFATTSTGDTLSGELNNAELTGWGLTGSITIDSSTTYDGSGENVLETTFPGGWSSFEANDLCTCSFQGQTGTISIRAYGTTSPNGYTSGIFVVDSGGAESGGLGTLAGWGTFTSAGHNNPNVLDLTEYLAIT